MDAKSKTIETKLAGKTTLKDIAKADRSTMRSDIYLVEKSLSKMLKKEGKFPEAEAKTLKGYTKQLKEGTEFIPNWVKFAVALALGLGTMIGWERIVVTVGEKIGKDRLTYAQGAAAELVAMTTIGAADKLGLPVSTTHVLSSGIAGAMTANGSGVQKDTVRSLLLAWVLTLPICILLGSATFSAGLFIREKRDKTGEFERAAMRARRVPRLKAIETAPRPSTGGLGERRAHAFVPRRKKL